MKLALRKLLIILLGLICLDKFCLGQTLDLGIKNYKTSIESPYHLDKKKDLTICITSTTLIATGFILKTLKTPIDSIDLADPDTSKIPKFDLSAIHQYDPAYVTASNVLEYTALLMPFISFVDKRVSGHASQVMVMYYEALTINLALYNMTSALVNRRRPLTFNTDIQPNGDPVVPLSDKQKPNVKESFFSGHTSNAAAATFFGAKIFTDFRPHSKLIPFVWVAAAAVPAFTAFSRYKAGKHFPSDVVTGYLIGASIGYLVPELHKIDKDNRVSLAPYLDGKGLAMSYTF